ncbi:monovalent cation/H(+) antiporter subunit G [Desulfovibrio sulfodismutans]|uniref:Monovalent cation/H(+) antiporter subunit G n=1 Tax=Desulfolutivibrio sulfodismutans TaxID=63561 RepID=A0A7K3NQV8_9BACT|nr:monovalent cation/H(+) antiporter subunit G [Desulfolutivibrio sulfodismutans]NDY58606.1 monovalent cation/H(+) antiporter subunit G [Desulfolutivibrio sulfodismutans]QLA12551.1 sodium:proton antiporter [Desulfolutivibrio sulfodismutans DSM 3696]
MDIAICILLGLGLLFFTGGTLGLIRLPDVYSRLHMAGKIDTMGSISLIAALFLNEIESFDMAHLLVGLKILLVLFFQFLASPTACHAMVDACLRAGLAPWVKGGQRSDP